MNEIDLYYFCIINMLNIKIKMANNTTDVTNNSIIFNPHKFSPTEIFSNNNGKTSSTKVIGFMASLVCLIIFIVLVFFYMINPGECANILEIIDRTITYFTVSAGLMGIKSVTSAFGKLRIELTTVSKENNNQGENDKSLKYCSEGTE